MEVFSRLLHRCFFPDILKKHFENLAFYATLEECYAPGRFDLFCNSHQLLVGTKNGVLGILQGVYWCPSLMLQQKQCVLSLFSITSSSPQISDERHRRETLKILPFWSFSPYRFRPRLWHCFIYIAIAGYAEATWHLKKNCSSSWNVSLFVASPPLRVSLPLNTPYTSNATHQPRYLWKP